MLTRVMATMILAWVASVSCICQAEEGLDMLDPFGEEEEVVDQRSVPITVSCEFENIPVGTLIRYVCLGTGLRYVVEGNVVVIADPANVQIPSVSTRFYRVSTAFTQILPENSDGNLTSFFASLGVKIPKDGGVRHVPRANRLVATLGNDGFAQLEDVINHLVLWPSMITDDDCDTATLPKTRAIGRIYGKLQSIVIPEVLFEDAEVAATMTWLQRITAQLDPEGKGIQVHYIPPPATEGDPFDEDDLLDEDGLFGEDENDE